jgi:ribosomal protein S18 acetylase RimI-like enzyme
VVSPARAEPLPAVRVDRARPEDFGRIAELTAGVYRDDGYADERYLVELRDVAARSQRAELLVARTAEGGIVGSVALVLDGEFGEVLRSPEEAGFRMLVVDPSARGGGVGELLVRSCLDRARAAGKRRAVISTDPRMTAAHRLYERLGFARLSERDWSPMEGIHLLVYALDLC